MRWFNEYCHMNKIPIYIAVRSLPTKNWRELNELKNNIIFCFLVIITPLIFAASGTIRNRYSYTIIVLKGKDCMPNANSYRKNEKTEYPFIAFLCLFLNSAVYSICQVSCPQSHKCVQSMPSPFINR